MWIEGRKPAAMAGWSLERDLAELAELAQATATKPAADHRLLPSLPHACPGCRRGQRVDQKGWSSGWAIPWVEERKPATMAGWSLERDLAELAELAELAQATATKPAADHRLPKIKHQRTELVSSR